MNKKNEMMNILAVDDSEVNLVVLKKMLKKIEANIDCVTSGQEALKQIQLKDYDVVLMDLQMPIMDGFETTRAIRNLNGEKYQSIPIIAVTANSMGDVMNNEVAIDDFIEKPFFPNKLKRIIFKHINK